MGSQDGKSSTGICFHISLVVRERHFANCTKFLFMNKQNGCANLPSQQGNLILIECVGLSIKGCISNVFCTSE